MAAVWWVIVQLSVQDKEVTLTDASTELDQP